MCAALRHTLLVMLQVENATAQAQLAEVRDRMWELSSGADDAKRRARDDLTDLSECMHEALAAARRSRVCILKFSHLLHLLSFTASALCCQWGRRRRSSKLLMLLQYLSTVLSMFSAVCVHAQMCCVETRSCNRHVVDFVSALFSHPSYR